ncbi:MAG: NAD-dependent epimerase/dehydratase family protein [Flavobacteriales bacterium]|nr:NAD-dependent epimerase/dehydratase family protein [Flavobacteriales bacterium]MCX7768965.1 NAD-dependent epimerase/dehydratase family protein [Flavobacteriales bacterium]MDW8410798.1 NAD-dependent epimerase/dehydratase family protein [Flavobacteriales bacterium]
MRIAIIGASGMVGRLLTNHLRQHTTHEVLALSRRPALPGHMCFNPEKDDWRLLGKLDVLINCAGIIRESRYSDFYDVHVQLVQTLLEKRSQVGQPRIIHFSVLGADERNPIPFLKSKGVGDAYLNQAPDVYILRPSIICLPESVLVQKFKLLLQLGRLLLNRTPVPRGFLNTRIQPVMPQDVLECIMRLIDQGFEEKIIPCAGPEPISFKELLEMAGRASGRRPTIPVEIPKSLVEPITKNFISVWFPEIINYDQFQLLFRDNTDSSGLMARVIGREPLSTRPFWMAQFSL